MSLPKWLKSKSPEVPENYTCDLCAKRPATVMWSVDATSFIRGWKQYACGRCAVEKQLAHAKERASVIPELEAWLDELVREEQGPRQ